MASKVREYTTLPVRRKTLRRLKGYKIGGVSYDELSTTFSTPTRRKNSSWSTCDA